MADQSAQPKEVPVPAEEEVKKTKPEEFIPILDDDSKSSENGDSTENGDAAAKENGKEDEEEEKKEVVAEDKEKVCTIKRKSVGGGDATDGKPAEGATPEKKAKLDEPADAESNGKTEVAA